MFEPHSLKIVCHGMSCSGKTYFANLLDHDHLVFDALFPWHEIETLGLSTSAALMKAAQQLRDNSILDGWHLSDIQGKYFVEGVTRYVIYASYEAIIDQYRIDVSDYFQHLHMYKKWYPNSYSGSTRFFKNEGDFRETTKEEYLEVTNS